CPALCTPEPRRRRDRRVARARLPALRGYSSPWAVPDVSSHTAVSTPSPVTEDRRARRPPAATVVSTRVGGQTTPPGAQAPKNPVAVRDCARAKRGRVDPLAALHQALRRVDRPWGPHWRNRECRAEPALSAPVVSGVRSAELHRPQVWRRFARGLRR